MYEHGTIIGADSHIMQKYEGNISYILNSFAKPENLDNVTVSNVFFATRNEFHSDEKESQKQCFTPVRIVDHRTGPIISTQNIRKITDQIDTWEVFLYICL